MTPRRQLSTCHSFTFTLPCAGRLASSLFYRSSLLVETNMLRAQDRFLRAQDPYHFETPEAKSTTPHLPDDLATTCLRGKHAPLNPHAQSMLAASTRTVELDPSNVAKPKEKKASKPKAKAKGKASAKPKASPKAKPKAKASAKKRGQDAPQHEEHEPTSAEATDSKPKPNTKASQEKAAKKETARTSYALAKEEFMQRCPRSLFPFALALRCRLKQQHPGLVQGWLEKQLAAYCKCPFQTALICSSHVS